MITAEALIWRYNRRTMIPHSRPSAIQIALLLALLIANLLAHILIRAPETHADRSAPGERYPQVLGDPDGLAVYWHDQRWAEGDFYACALYAQAAVLESFGYDFTTELAAARDLGVRDGWYLPDAGAIGLGQPLRARGVTFEVFGTAREGTVSPREALYRLRRGIVMGDYALVNLDATRLSIYRGSAIAWHTIWITGLRLDALGRITTVIANDSYHGAGVEYPVDEFLAAWGHERLNYYAIFVHPPEGAKTS